MEISQLSLALFLLISAACGAILGALYDLTAILPAVCGRVFDLKLHERLYGINLPWIKRTLRAKKTVPREFFRNTAIFVHDLVRAVHYWYYTCWAIYKESVNEDCGNLLLVFYNQCKKVVKLAHDFLDF